MNTSNTFQAPKAPEPNFNNLNQAVNNAGIPSKASTSGHNMNYSMNLPEAEKGALEETLTDASKQFDLTKDASADKFNNLNDASNFKFDTMQDASAGITSAQQNANANQFQNITDMLRGATLNANRVGESASDGVTGRMLTQANMQAAREYAGLESKALLDEANRTFGNVQQLATDNYSNAGANQQEVFTAATELANTVGATQEETLPVVTLAEEILTQAEKEGKIAELNAMDRFKYRLDLAKTLMDNPSFAESLKAGVGVDMVTLDDQFNQEQTMFANRVANLAKIPELRDAILRNVSDEMFAYYKAQLGEIKAIWQLGLEQGLVDPDGYFIPGNSYAKDAVGDSVDANLNDMANAGATSDNIADWGVNKLSSAIGQLVNDFGGGNNPPTPAGEVYE